METFALLDDRDANAQRPTSRLYTGFVREHCCTDPATLEQTWAAAQADMHSGLHALMLVDYSWGAKLHGVRAPGDEGACLRLLMFRNLQRLSKEEVDAWLQRLDGGRVQPSAAGVCDLRETVSRQDFADAIDGIHAAIRDGETYQINYTYRVRGRSWGHPVALYRRLRTRQPVSYGAFVSLPEGGAVLSCSPELFLRHQSGLITAKPMKGTAPRLQVAEADSVMARWLSEDTKNRAENLMIVDLLRNDLGRIARIGSVRVPQLFGIESHPTVFQMTSTVQAQIAPGVGLPELLRATFPCGSITGAPKKRTMELIAELESTPRGLYTGSIGWLDLEPGQTCPDLCLSVAIRTSLLSAPLHDIASVEMGLGAGITLDSQADAEFEECRLKGRFLTGLHGTSDTGQGKRALALHAS
ncbi:aminodeoxychorismate synthase component I [Azohydromonas australica]|uniref:aminodeoxychorismate synthase component I n=1 Tax=Azohydromonas australica TaxID=364039 RepID=UPI00041A9063|nr:aminodeoxychorismate synthase component I [Azohydromonas australica]